MPCIHNTSQYLLLSHPIKHIQPFTATMHSLKLFFPLVALSLFSFLLDSTLAADPLYTICSTSGNYSAGDPYDYTLSKVLASLNVKVPPTGFGTASAGGHASPAYGLALCRGDVSSSACKTCVAEAATRLRQECPNQKEAITWYDNCLLRYSDAKFIGSIYSGTRVYMWNTQEVTSRPKVFNQKVVALLKRASARAYKKPKLFGTEEETAIVVNGRKETLYSLTQCTRDLSPAECQSCLENIIGDFPNCCNAKIGGRVLTGSCNFRYEIYPFY